MLICYHFFHCPGSAEDILTSDHKPVFASFDVAIATQYVPNQGTDVECNKDVKIIFENVTAEVGRVFSSFYLSMACQYLFIYSFIYFIYSIYFVYFIYYIHFIYIFYFVDFIYFIYFIYFIFYFLNLFYFIYSLNLFYLF